MGFSLLCEAWQLGIPLPGSRPQATGEKSQTPSLGGRRWLLHYLHTAPQLTCPVRGPGTAPAASRSRSVDSPEVSTTLLRQSSGSTRGCLGEFGLSHLPVTPQPGPKLKSILLPACAGELLNGRGEGSCLFSAWACVPSPPLTWPLGQPTPVSRLLVLSILSKREDCRHAASCGTNSLPSTLEEASPASACPS